jgi:hypothetical protein
MMIDDAFSYRLSGVTEDGGIFTFGGAFDKEAADEEFERFSRTGCDTDGQKLAFLGMFERQTAEVRMVRVWCPAGGSL